MVLRQNEDFVMLEEIGYKSKHFMHIGRKLYSLGISGECQCFGGNPKQTWHWKDHPAQPSLLCSCVSVNGWCAVVFLSYLESDVSQELRQGFCGDRTVVTLNLQLAHSGLLFPWIFMLMVKSDLAFLWEITRVDSSLYLHHFPSSFFSCHMCIWIILC